MSDILASVTGNVASLAVYLAIAAMFVICMVKCVVPVMHHRARLRQAVRRMKKGASADRSWQEEDFLGRGAMQPHWKEYLNNLFFADGEFHNPSNVEDFINEDTVILGPGNTQLAEAAPGLMVSLGFLGTLIGMTAGLSGFDMQDSEAVMGSIRTLLPGIRYAFTTSIVGVVASILTTLIVRGVNASATRALTAFYGAMNEYAGVVSVDPMTQIAIYQQEQTALIQRLEQSVNGDMADKMARSMAAAVGKSYQNMQQSMDDFMSYATDSQMRGMNALVDRFMQQMNAAVSGQFKNLAMTLEDTSRNQARMNDTAKTNMDALGQLSGDVLRSAKATNELMENVRSYLKMLSANATAQQEGYDRIQATVEHLDVVARQFNGYLMTVTKVEGEMRSACEAMEKSGQALMEAVDKAVNSSAEGMNRAASAMTDSAQILAGNHKALVGGISQDIDRTYNDFFKATNELVDRVGWVVGDLKAAVEQLPPMVQGTSDLYAQQAAQLADSLRAARAALDEAVDRLGGTQYQGR